MRDPHFSSPRRVSPFLAWGDFHARSRLARSTISEEKWGTTRSLAAGGQRAVAQRHESFGCKEWASLPADVLWGSFVTCSFLPQWADVK